MPQRTRSRRPTAKGRCCTTQVGALTVCCFAAAFKASWSFSSRPSASCLFPADRHSAATPEVQKEEEKKFKEVGEAFTVLSDPKKKVRYDNGHDLDDDCGFDGRGECLSSSSSSTCGCRLLLVACWSCTTFCVVGNAWWSAEVNLFIDKIDHVYKHSIAAERGKRINPL